MGVVGAAVNRVHDYEHQPRVTGRWTAQCTCGTVIYGADEVALRRHMRVHLTLVTELRRTDYAADMVTEVRT